VKKMFSECRDCFETDLVVSMTSTWQ